MKHQNLFTEVFPIEVEKLPELTAYSLEVGSSGDASRIGGKLSYRLRKRFSGHWVWTVGKIITDQPQTEEEIKKFIEELWREQPDIYTNLIAVRKDPNWHSVPEALADFVARGLILDIDLEINEILSRREVNIGPARIERIYECRGWVVNGTPSISISVASRLILNQELTEYASNVQNHKELVGIWVADKTSNFKGEIIDIVGKLRDHRARLLALSKNEKMQNLIKNAPDDEIVVSVGRNEYHYIISALRIIVRMEDFERFSIDSKKALRVLRIDPEIRSQLIGEVSSIVKNKLPIKNYYNSHDYPKLFIVSRDIGFEPCFRLGKDQICKGEKNLLQNLRKYGIYKRAKRFQDDVPIRIGIINSLGSVDLGNFLSELQDELSRFGFKSQIVCEREINKVERHILEEVVSAIQEEANPDILLTFFPEMEEFYDDEEEWGAYHIFKSIAVSRGIPSQVVYESTLSNQYVIPNIVLGILGKTGNIPFILAEPLKYADIVVGIDVARKQKRRLPGSINAIAMARIYLNNGEFLRYVIHDVPLEGEIIPDNVLQSLFPTNEFKNKRVVIHRDGFFRGNEKEALKEWANKIGATFYLVEVIKTGTPRLYEKSKGKIQQPKKGSAFILNETEAFLVSSLPPFTRATPRPLRIRTEPPFTIKEAIHSVLSLTLLHYGSLMPPRAPVTIHYGDKIAYLALRGIKPKELEGNIPYWL